MITRRNTLFNVAVDDQSTPFLQFLAQGFPQEYRRALRALGFWLKGKTQEAMRSRGATIGQSWPDRALMTRYRRLTLLKQGHWSERLGRWTKSSKLKLRRGAELDFHSGKKFEPLGPEPFGSKLLNAVRFKVEADRVRIGFLTASASGFASAVQDGRRGAYMRFEYPGDQPVSPNTRRMFWAAGIPLSKGKTDIKEPKRPLVKPLFDRARPEIAARLEARIQAYLLGLSGKDASAFVRNSIGGDA